MWKRTIVTCYAGPMADTMSLSRRPSLLFSGLIARISGYRSSTEPSWFIETAEMVFPLVFNLGQPWDIRLGSEGDANRSMSFTAGLYPGPVSVSCAAGAELLQVDLTPLGAARLFGGAAAELAGRVVDLRSVDRFAGEHDAIHDLLHRATNWAARFDLIERFLAPRFTYASSSHVRKAWSLLAQGHTVAETADAIGWSTRYLRKRFQHETGIRPVTAARMLRFQHARAFALRSDNPDWADIALAAGYADQAHLIRAFHEFAGEPPMAWASSARPSEPRLQV
jgi:AraC-like DNA-binding protein